MLQISYIIFTYTNFAYIFFYRKVVKNVKIGEKKRYNKKL